MTAKLGNFMYLEFDPTLDENKDMRERVIQYLLMDGSQKLQSKGKSPDTLLDVVFTKLTKANRDLFCIPEIYLYTAAWRTI